MTTPNWLYWNPAPPHDVVEQGARGCLLGRERAHRSVAASGRAGSSGWLRSGPSTGAPQLGRTSQSRPAGWSGSLSRSSALPRACARRARARGRTRSARRWKPSHGGRGSRRAARRARLAASVSWLPRSRTAARRRGARGGIAGSAGISELRRAASLRCKRCLAGAVGAAVCRRRTRRPAVWRLARRPPLEGGRRAAPTLGGRRAAPPSGGRSTRRPIIYDWWPSGKAADCRSADPEFESRSAHALFGMHLSSCTFCGSALDRLSSCSSKSPFLSALFVVFGMGRTAVFVVFTLFALFTLFGIHLSGIDWLHLNLWMGLIGFISTFGLVEIGFCRVRRYHPFRRVRRSRVHRYRCTIALIALFAVVVVFFTYVFLDRLSSCSS
eukprot:scaffold79988_cov63-Phaeocystis_antarctica.AAC.1